nr:Rieske 2Fe-2S domain-containing protein [Haladaptatus sp. R4]
MATKGSFVRVADADELREDTPQIVQANGHSIGLFFHEDEFYAIDNRCPHMGFPLTKGSVDDGVLTCHWHHARFEMSCGDTFDPFADDVQTYPVEIRDGEVYVQPNPPRTEPPEEHWRNRLEHGLQENIDLVVAKAVIGLESEGVPSTVPVELGAEFGTHYRQAGWGRGLTTLGVMANLLDDVRAEDRRRALYVGLTEVADECSGEPPFFVQESLSTEDVSAGRLTEWFRDNIEVRDSDGAERVLRAAIGEGLDESKIAGMLVAPSPTTSTSAPVTDWISSTRRSRRWTTSGGSTRTTCSPASFRGSRRRTGRKRTPRGGNPSTWRNCVSTPPTNCRSCSKRGREKRGRNRTTSSKLSSARTRTPSWTRSRAQSRTARRRRNSPKS